MKATCHTAAPMLVHDLPTPALVIDGDVLEANLATMAAARPGAALRPHVKAHKCTALARRQAEHGHHTFTCATPREALGMAAAGLGADLLVANEVVDARRLEALAALDGDVMVTVAIDSAGHARCRRPRRAAPLRRRRRRRPPPLRLRTGRGRTARRRRPRPRAHRARRDGVRGPPDDGRRPGRAARTGRGGDGAAAGRPRRRRRGHRLRRRHRHVRPPRPHRHHRAAGRQLRADGHRLRQLSASRSGRRCRWSGPSSP